MVRSGMRGIYRDEKCVGGWENLPGEKQVTFFSLGKALSSIRIPYYVGRVTKETDPQKRSLSFPKNMPERS